MLKLERIALAAAMSLLVGTTAWAGSDPEDEALRAELEMLKSKISRIESQINQGGATTTAADGSTVPTIGLPSGLSGVTISGFVSAGMMYNFNEPKGRTNTLRVFDTRSNEFMFHNVELAVEKLATEDSRGGFRGDLDFGSDSEVTGSVTTGLGSTTDELDIQQGYVEYLAPVGNGLDIKFGKFNTLHGAEVLEPAGNWNYSRSFLYGYAEPLSHTGIRTHYAWNDMLTTMVGLSNGWDVVDDNNRAKSVELGASILPMEGVSISTAYMVGAEQNNDSHDLRHFWSLVLGYDPTEVLHFKLAADVGFEKDAVSENEGGNATWNGIAAYARYDVTDWYSVAGRVEVFNDNDNTRTGAAVPASVANADLRLMGWTLTNEFRLAPNLITRLEYRLDQADSHVFPMRKGLENYQNSVGAEVTYVF